LKGYYFITDSALSGKGSEHDIRCALKENVRVIQYREKNASTGRMFKEAREYARICGESGKRVIFLVNDRIDIALAADADGVHIGQDDLPCRAARKIAPNMIIGVSTHNFFEIGAAERDKATYINIGPVFATSTKKLKVKPLGLDYLQDAIIITELPFTVMGGINKDNIVKVLECGVRNIAMVTAITQAANIVSETREFVEIIESYKKKK